MTFQGKQASRTDDVIDKIEYTVDAEFRTQFGNDMLLSRNASKTLLFLQDVLRFVLITSKHRQPEL